MSMSINGNSSYSSFISSTSSTTSTSNSKKFADELLKKLDTNGDGSIDKSELSAALSAPPKDGVTVSLSKAVNSDDDSLDDDGLAAFSPPPPIDSEQLFSALDADGDGSISVSELSNALQGSDASGDANSTTSSSSTDTGSDAINSLFSALDADSSGSVSADELSSALNPDSSGQQSTTTQSTEALHRIVAALSDRYNLNSTATAGKYVSTSV